MGEALGAMLAPEAPRYFAMQLHRSEVSFALVVGEADVEVVHESQDGLAVRGEGGGEVERAPFQVVALSAVRPFGVGGPRVGDEAVVARGEGALEGGPELFEAAPSGVVTGGVHLHEQRGEPG